MNMFSQLGVQSGFFVKPTASVPSHFAMHSRTVLLLFDSISALFVNDVNTIV